MSPIVIASVVGARPQFVKAAAVTPALRTQQGLAEVLIHTGQHYDDDMSDTFFRELDLPAPDFQLGVAGGSHGAMTGRMLAEIESVLVGLDAGLVLVYGDTNSTLAATLAAAKLAIPVAHVEAGLRCFDRTMPEEVNRVVADHLSSLFFCGTETAVTNLAAEGIREEVHLVGDVMFDVALRLGDRARRESTITKSLGLDRGEYVLLTIHRAANTSTKSRLLEVLKYVSSIADGRRVVLPVHPRTRKAAVELGVDLTVHATLTPPLGFLDFTRLLQDARVVATDSGGVQKEAYFHRVPCVTLRDSTEWVETIEAGWNRLWTEPHYLPRRDIAEYGRGDAGEQIAAHVARFLTT